MGIGIYDKKVIRNFFKAIEVSHYFPMSIRLRTDRIFIYCSECVNRHTITVYFDDYQIEINVKSCVVTYLEYMFAANFFDDRGNVIEFGK